MSHVHSELGIEICNCSSPGRCV